MKRMMLGIQVALIVLLASGARAEEPIRNWQINLGGFYREGTAPLTIYASEQDGRWRSGIASSQFDGRRKFNSSWQYPDLSQVPIVDGKMRGLLTVYMTPDLWVPVGHRMFKVLVDVDAAVTAEGALSGTYTVRPVESKDESLGRLSLNGGKLTASVSAGDKAAKPFPDLFSVSLLMQGSLVGGKPSNCCRCMILHLGIEKGKAVKASRAFMAQNRTSYMQVDVPPGDCSVTVTGNRVSGKVAVKAETLDLDPCEYVFDFTAIDHYGTMVGPYTVTVKRDGQPDLQIEGSFDGNWDEGVSQVEYPERSLDVWAAPVPGHKPVEPGEHPRILFRRTDVPALRERAKTEEGQAILKRLRYLLDARNGEEFAPVLSSATNEYSLGGRNNLIVQEPGVYTFSHIVGYGLLYQLTGEAKYAELGRKAFEVALAGQRDRDDRYAFRKAAALRGGPALGWYAVGYDLCYDGWDEATRERFGKEIAGYEAVEGGNKFDLEDLARGTMPPGSNHYGMQVGGASLALLAITGETWADQKRLDYIIKLARVSMIRNITEGFGNGGFFMEGDGTGSMATYISYLTGLQAWKNVMGMDFVNSGRSNVPMTTMKWIYQTLCDPEGGLAGLRHARERHKGFKLGSFISMKGRGAYLQNVWDRDGLSGAGYFAIGFSGVTEAQKPALLWFYNHNLKVVDEAMGMPFDTVSPYPHHAVCAFVNWPVGMKERNPGEYLPLCYSDDVAGFMAWRNRWQDINDTLISVATGRTHGYHSTKPDKQLTVTVKGRPTNWGTVSRDCGGRVYWRQTPRGDMSAFTLANGVAFGVDFSGKSGADVLMVTTGDAEGSKVKLGDRTLTFFFPGAAESPTPVVDGDHITVGEQVVKVVGGNIAFGAVAGTDNPK